MTDKIKFVKAPVTSIDYSAKLDVVAFAIYDNLFIYSVGKNELIKVDDSANNHTALIRSIDFIKDSSILVTTSADFTIKLWNTTDYKCTKTINTQKKIKSTAITKDQDALVLSDKNGDIYIYYFNQVESTVEKKPEEKGEEANLLLGHYSSITDTIFSQCFGYIMTSDRDEKIRVSKFPNAFDVETFCLGHTQFVSKMMILNGRPELLVSGAGDGSIKLWNWKLGKLIQTIDLMVGEDYTITIPQYYDEATKTLFVSIEGRPVLHCFTFDESTSQFNVTPTTIAMLASPMTCQVMGNDQLLVSHATIDSMDVPLVSVVSVGGKSLVSSSAIATSINTSSSVLFSEEKMLQSLPDQIMKLQHKKYLCLNEHKLEKVKAKKSTSDDTTSATAPSADTNNHHDDADSQEVKIKQRRLTTQGESEVTATASN
eukprot:gene14485-17089_t